MFYKGSIIINTLEELKQLKSGAYKVSEIKSDDPFFDVLTNKSFLVLYKIGDLFEDTWINITTSTLEYYHAFCNNNGEIKPLKKIF